MSHSAFALARCCFHSGPRASAAVRKAAAAPWPTTSATPTGCFVYSDLIGPLKASGRWKRLRACGKCIVHGHGSSIPVYWTALLNGWLWPGVPVLLSDILQPLKAATRPLFPRGGRQRQLQISVCSDISRASSTAMPRYLAVDSSLEWPSRNCTARRFLVRR